MSEYTIRDDIPGLTEEGRLHLQEYLRMRIVRMAKEITEDYNLWKELYERLSKSETPNLPEV